MKTDEKHESQIMTLIGNLKDLLNKGNAHVSFDDAVHNIDFDLLGKKPHQLPYSIWQLAEHIRITQSDILEFSRDGNHQSPQWPVGYWPLDDAPDSEEKWQHCLKQITSERMAFVKLLESAGENIYHVFEHGSGQSLLKEALVLADHNSYHTGEIILLRRLLNDWKK